MVGVTRSPEIVRQSVDELKAVARRLGDAHDRAKDFGARQAREIRGEADPRGAKPARDNAGTLAKGQALLDAMERVEAELVAVRPYRGDASSPRPSDPFFGRLWPALANSRRNRHASRKSRFHRP